MPHQSGRRNDILHLQIKVNPQVPVRIDVLVSEVIGPSDENNRPAKAVNHAGFIINRWACEGEVSDTEFAALY